MLVVDECFCIVAAICHPTGVFQQLFRNRLDRPVALLQFVEERDCICRSAIFNKSFISENAFVFLNTLKPRNLNSKTLTVE